MVRSLPLRQGFFATPQVSLSDETDLLLWGRSLVPDLRHQPETEWTLLHEKRGVQVCEDRQKGGLTYSIRGVATVRATLDDVMELFAAATTTQFRGLMQLQLREFFADAAVLYHSNVGSNSGASTDESASQGGSGDSETLGIKWLAMRNKKSAINPMVHTHDFCVLEYAGILGADAIGGDPDKPIGVCVYESIEQMECPSLYESHRLERGSISKCGYLFTPREDGVVEAQFVCSIRQPPNQRSKRRLNRALLVNWAESVGAIEESISRKRISRDLTLRRQPVWVNDKDRQCCHLCLKTFTNTRRKHHCRACGEIICRACSLYKSVELATVGLTTLRVCKACMDGTKAAAAAADKDSASTTPQSMASSTATGSGTSAELALPLPKGVDDHTLRDAVEEFALALPTQPLAAATVPDLVGLAWLQQIAARDPSKRDMVSDLMERLRLEAQDQYEPESSSAEQQVDIYDTLCDLAAQALACKYAVVSLIDENRQWFKSAVNVREADVPRDFSFCEYPVRDQQPLVVMDALRDSRFMHHPFVTGPLAVRFLAGAPLFTVDNECVGAVCVLDTEPRHVLQENQIATMQNLAHLAMVMVQERREAQAKVARAAAASSQLVPAGRAMASPYQLHHQAMMHPLHHAPPPQAFHPSYSYGPTGPPSSGSSTAMPSDMVPLSSYAESSLVVQTSKQQPSPPREDPVLKEQMIQLLHKASQVRDQVNLQSQQSSSTATAGAQQQQQQLAGLQSSGE